MMRPRMLHRRMLPKKSRVLQLFFDQKKTRTPLALPPNCKSQSPFDRLGCPRAWSRLPPLPLRSLPPKRIKAMMRAHGAFVQPVHMRGRARYIWARLSGVGICIKINFFSDRARPLARTREESAGKHRQPSTAAARMPPTW